MRQIIKNVFYDLRENLIHFHLRNGEIRKFKDPRRKIITNKVVLSAEQKKQIDKTFINHYGKKIPYTWHRHYTAFTGIFDPLYFPELIYIPEFQRYENLWPEYCKVFSDKNCIPIIASKANVKTPYCYISSTKGIIKDHDGNIITREKVIDILSSIGSVFIKPTIDSSSGRGCMMVDFINGIDIKTGKSVSELLRAVGLDFCVQETISCHESIKRLHPESVNTFRIMTYRWKNDFLHAPCTMRIGSGSSYLDNVHSGGMCISIDDDGILHNRAFTEFDLYYDRHPDTKILFKGYKIENFNLVIDAAIRMHKEIPQVGVIHWDFTIDSDGVPILIEANMNNTSIQLIERPLGRGPFGEKTLEILDWMNLMRNTKPHERFQYAFGVVNSNKKDGQ